MYVYIYIHLLCIVTLLSPAHKDETASSCLLVTSAPWVWGSLPLTDLTGLRRRSRKDSRLQSPLGPVARLARANPGAHAAGGRGQESRGHGVWPRLPAAAPFKQAADSECPMGRSH